MNESEQNSKLINLGHFFADVFREFIGDLVCALVVLTVCGMSFYGKEVVDPLYSLSLIVTGYLVRGAVESSKKAAGPATQRAVDNPIPQVDVKP